MARTPKGPKSVDTIVHDEATRRNIPTAEQQAFAERMEEDSRPGPVHYPRSRPLEVGTTRERDEDLDPQIIWNGARLRLTKEQIAQLSETGEVELGDAQLVWRGKDTQDWSDLVVATPPLYIQEKIHPKALIDDLKRREDGGYGPGVSEGEVQTDLFADFNGIPEDAKTDFYQHDQHWSNRMILGDSLQVMASLAEREHLAGKVQCIYFDPPYGIKFNSNWQVSTQSRDVKDGKQTDISREPEQVKAFRDTWKDGIHSYLTYLRDRLTVMRELLHETGSIFIQISNENTHRVRSLLDEIFGVDNFVSQIVLKTTSGAGSPTGGTASLAAVHDYIIWYAKSRTNLKYRQVYFDKSEMATAGLYRRVGGVDGSDRSATEDELSGDHTIPTGYFLYRPDNLTSQSSPESALFEVSYDGILSRPGKGGWKTNSKGMERLKAARRIFVTSNRSFQYVRKFDDFNVSPINDVWTDVGTGSFTADKLYVVQTNTKIVSRCILMATDPGDLVLDPTCGSGTTAFVAEQWGRRWVTVDTSRVALALARTRLMSARYPYYLLADSQEGRRKVQELSGLSQHNSSNFGDIRQGFVYERAPKIQLRNIANNAEIDIIWDKWQAIQEPLREKLNGLLDKTWQEWEIPREIVASWPEEAKTIHDQWWQARIARQKEIDASIAKRADVEMLYDRPYQDNNRVRVAGPFTVESLSPHRVVPADAEELQPADPAKRSRNLAAAPATDFAQIVLENLKTSGVQQSTRAEKISWTALETCRQVREIVIH